MKRIAKRIVAPIALASLAIFFAAACRPFAHKSPEERAEWISGKIASKLDLNDSQKKELVRIKSELLDKVKSTSSHRKEIADQLIANVKEDKLDRAKLKEFQKTLDQDRAQMEDLFVDKLVEFHKILTPEQRKVAAEHLSKFREYMH